MSYNEVFQSGHEPEEGLSWSSKWEASAHSPDEDVESYDVGEGEEEEVDKGKDEGDKGGKEGEGDEDASNADKKTTKVGSSGSPPFILPSIWTINDFLPKMTTNIFKNLRDRYQMLNHIPIRLSGKFEKCYSGKIVDVSMYDATFAIGLRLPLTALHHQLANFLGLSVSQIAPNSWRIFIGAEILWGRLSGRNCQLSLDEFFYCYKP